jgi:hypothetical protein
MSQATTLATAAIVGAVAGAVAGALIAISPLGSRSLGPIHVAIVLRQPSDGPCRVETQPFRPRPARKADEIRWTVAGHCADINPDNVEIQFVGTCGTTGKTEMDPDLFEQPAPHRGRQIIRTVKSEVAACYRYRVVHNGTELEDPELEIMQ